MICVGIADDHPIVRKTLRILFSHAKDYQVLFEAQDGQQALDLTMRHEPDVLLLDIHMPCLNGLEVLSALPKTLRTRVLVLSMLADEAIVVKAFECGARGYVLKKDLPEELMSAIQKVNASGTFLSAGISDLDVNPSCLAG